MHPTFFAHLRDIVLLPFTVTVIIPALLLSDRENTFDPSVLRHIFGVVIILGALTLFSNTVLLFIRQGNGTLAPWTPTQKLIIHGPYRYCRNPMITSVFIILLGEALFFGNFYVLCWAGIFFTINTFYFVMVEEPSMKKRFGKEYQEYVENVPRWIPRTKPYSLNH